MNDQPAIRPSPSYYALGGAIIALGIGFFLYSLLHGIFHLTDNLTQVVVPGEKELTLQPGLKYTIFLEEQSVVDGRIYATRESTLNGLTCTVTSQTTGNRIDTHRATMSTNYNVNGRSGHSVLEFVSEEAGTYHLACDYEEGKQGPQAVLAVGSGVTEEILATIGKSLGSMLGGGALGAAIIVTVFIRREREKRRLAQPGAPLY
jgi:hypothetical protein